MLRKAVLTAHPLCVMCEREGMVAPATEVHHVVPVEYGLNYADKTRLMYDRGNLMALCHECHVKVHTDMGKSGKEATKRRNDEHVSAIVKKYFG